MQEATNKILKRRGRQRLLSCEQIIDAAKAIIVDPDVEFSMRELGARLGVPHKTLYNYFDSRELLIKSVLVQVVQAIPRLNSHSPLSIREQLRNELRGWRDLMACYYPVLEAGNKPVKEQASLNLAHFAPSIEVLANKGIAPLRALLVYCTLLNWVISMSRSMTRNGNWNLDYTVLSQDPELAQFPAMRAAIADAQFPKNGNDFFEASVELLLDELLGDLPN